MSGDNFNFLILGAGRGGTSLLAGLLDYHPELEVGFEHASIATLMGKSISVHDTRIFSQRVEAFVDACKEKAGQNSNTRWGNKITTEQLFGLEDHNVANPTSEVDVFDSFFNHYLKDQAVVFILRDGRTCINSKVRRTGQSIELACRRWQYSVDCYKFLRTRHNNNICVRFEDLVQDSEPTLSEICDFLGIPYREEMLAGTTNKKMLPEYQSGFIDRSKTELIDLPDTIMEQIKDDLIFCGYC